VMPEQHLLPTLARLERLAIDSVVSLSALFPHLNPNCTHLWLYIDALINDLHLHESLHAHLSLFPQLTHLRVYSLPDIGALHFLCEHAIALRHLDVRFMTEVSVVFHLKLASSVFMHIGFIL